MFASPAQLIAFQRQSLESVQAIALASFVGLEKLANLNVQAAKAPVEDSVQRSTSILEAQDAKALVGTITGFAAGDKFTAYRKHLYEIASETGAEIQKAVEQRLIEGNRQLTASMEAMAQGSPMSSESVMTLVKSAVSAASASWNQVNQASLQMQDMARANFDNAANGARTAGKRKVS